MNNGYACATERGLKYHMQRNEPCRICKEWWAKVQAGTAAPVAPAQAKAKPKKRAANTGYACGERHGHSRHTYHGEPICDACRDAFNAYRRELRAAKNADQEPKKLPPIKHGTPHGRKQHRARNEPVCTLCREAYNKDMRDRYAAKRGGPPKRASVAECATPAGYGAHIDRGEKPCEPCRAARNKRRVELRAQKKAEANK